MFYFQNSRVSTLQSESGSTNCTVLGGGLAAVISVKGRKKVGVRRGGREAGSLYKVIL